MGQLAQLITLVTTDYTNRWETYPADAAVKA
jgi:hypothetical protein